MVISSNSSVRIRGLNLYSVREALCFLRCPVLRLNPNLLSLNFILLVLDLSLCYKNKSLPSI